MERIQKRSAELTDYFNSVAYGEIDRVNRHMDEIIPGLFVGNLQAAVNIEQLNIHGITHVLNVRQRVDSVTMENYEANSIEFAHVPMADCLFFDMKRNINAAIAFIRMALSDEGKILVHCLAGKSRSATVVAAYLITTRDYDALSASIELCTKRPQVLPNETFRRFLCVLEEKVKSATRDPVVDDKMDSDAPNDPDLK
jgi:protein-tyrosine phosphatase